MEPSEPEFPLKKFTLAGGTLVGDVAVFGFLVPWAMSAGSTLAVMTGVVGAIGAVSLTIYSVWHLINKE